MTLHSLHILLVDADVPSQPAFEQAIQAAQLPYTYTVVPTVAQACAALAQQAFDVTLLSDSVKDGVNALAGSNCPPLIFLATPGNEAAAAEAFQQGAADVLIRDERQGYLKLLPPKLEKLWHAQQADLNQLFMSNPLPMWIYDVETLAFLEVNEAAIQKYGYSHDEFLRLTLKDIRPPEDVPRLMSNLQNARPVLQESTDWRHCLKTGQVIDVEIISHPLKFAGRQARLVTINDVTQRQQAEAALRESEERFRQIAENTDDIFYLADYHTAEILYVNPAFERMTGYHLSDLGRYPNLYLNIIHPEDRVKIQAILQGENQHPPLAPLEYRIICADGSVRLTQNRLFQVNDAQGQPYRLAGFIEDITERRLAESQEHEQRRLAEALANVTLTLTSKISLDEVLDEILNQTAHLVPFKTANIALLEGSKLRIERWAGYSDGAFISRLSQNLEEFKLDANVVHLQQPIIIKDTSQETEWSTIPETAWIRSYLALPLILHTRTIGLLRLDSDQVNAFTVEHINHLLPLASAAAIAIENARLYAQAQQEITERKQAEQQERQQRQLAESLANTALALTSKISLEEVLDEILRQTAALVSFRTANIALIDGDELRVGRTLGYDEDNLKANPIHLISDYPIDETAIRTQQPAVLEDTHQHPQWVLKPDRAWIRSYICLPLGVQDRVIGLLRLTSHQVGHFTSVDIQKLLPLASAAAITIENARLYTQAQQELAERRQAELQERQQRQFAESLSNTTLALTSKISLEDVLDEILLQTAYLVNFRTANIALIHGDELHVESCLGYDENNFVGNLAQVINDYPVDAAAIRTRQPIILYDTHQEPQWVTMPERTWIRSYLSLPLCVQERVIGLLRLDGDQTGQFTTLDIEKLLPLASAAAIAIENARLYAQAQQEITERKQAELQERQQRQFAESLASATLALTSKIGLEEVLDEILRQSATLVNFQTAHIALIHGDELRVECTWGYNENTFTSTLHQPITDYPIDAEVIRTRQPLILHDTHQEPRWVIMPKGAWIRAYICLPLYIQERVIGLLRLDGDQVGQFTNEEVQKLLPLASAAAIAIENARLYTQSQQEIAERKDAQIALETLNLALERRVEQRTLELYQAKDRLESIFNSSSDAFILAYRHNGIQQTNEAFDRLFRTNPDDYFGKPLSAIVLPQERERLDKVVEMVIKNQITRRLEVTALRSDGKTFEAELALAPLAISDKETGVVCNLHDVTLRKQIEKALENSETEMRALFAAMDDFIIVLDDTGRFLKFAPTRPLITHQYIDMNFIGATVGHTLHDAFPTETADHFLAKIQEVLQTRQTIQLEHAFGSDNHKVWMTFSISPLAENTVLTVGRNITANKAAEEALQRSEANLRAIFNNAPLGFVFVDRDFNVLTSNTWAEKQMLALFQQQFMPGQSTLSLMPERIHPQWFGLTNQVLTGQQQRFQVPIEADGRQFIYDVLSIPVRADEQSDPMGICFIVEDITERQHAQEELRTTHNQLQAILDNSPAVIYLKDLEGRYLLGNQHAFPQIATLVEGTQLLHRTNQEIYAPETAAQFALNDQQVMEKGVVMQFEETVPHTDGSQHTYLSAKFPLRDQNGQIYAIGGISTDITTLKEAENELKRALEREQELNRLKTSFVSTVSHEFRTPLATIQASSDSLKIYMPRMTPEQIQGKLEKIQGQVQRMTNLLEDVLTLGRIQAGRVDFAPTWMDIYAFCQDIVEDLERSDKKEHQFRFEYPALVESIFADEKLLRQIVTNLLTNAIKYSPEKSLITLQLSQSEVHTTLRFSDEGIGIPLQDQERLFEPFHRASNVGNASGTGLGLAITKTAVEVHGGNIRLESTVDVGTTFIVTLPNRSIAPVINTTPAYVPGQYPRPNPS